MELRIYDRNLNFLGVVENQRSLLWTRRYFEAGSFQVYVPITDYNVTLFKRGNLITYRGAGDAGVIESLTLEENNLKTEILAEGRFLSSYMDRRLIRGTTNFNGKVEVAMRQLLSNATPLPLVRLGELKGFGETVEFQATYKNLLEYETKLAMYANFGFRFIPDFTAKTITFDVYKGVDRSRTQKDRAFVEFSDEFSNINTMMYIENEQMLKNVAYVGGEGEGSARTIVQVGNTASTGLDRRELFVDARDLQSDDLTTAQYRAILTQRGNDVMKEYALAETMECSADANLNFKYRVDYDLGDIVTVKKKKWQISKDLRITEVMEVYEHGNMEVAPTFGSPLPTKIDWTEVY